MNFVELKADVVRQIDYEISRREAKLAKLQDYRLKESQLTDFAWFIVKRYLDYRSDYWSAQRDQWQRYKEIILADASSDPIPTLDRIIRYFRPIYLYMTYVAWISMGQPSVVLGIAIIRSKFHALLELRKCYEYIGAM